MTVPKGPAGDVGPGAGSDTIFQVKEACALALPSDRVRTTANVPSVVGVPASIPVEVLSEIPGGRLAALQVQGTIVQRLEAAEKRAKKICEARVDRMVESRYQP